MEQRDNTKFVERRKNKGFFDSPNGHSASRLISVVVSLVLLFMIVGVQVASIRQSFLMTTPVHVVDVSYTVVLLLLASYAPKIVESVVEVIKKKDEK